jgi:hypothetical protein
MKIMNKVEKYMATHNITYHYGGVDTPYVGLFDRFISYLRRKEKERNENTGTTKGTKKKHV